jgi:hypothetical protein
MEPTEIQAKATIAAALIMSHAVQLPTIPMSGDWSHDSACAPPMLRDTIFRHQLPEAARCSARAVPLGLAYAQRAVPYCTPLAVNGVHTS